MMTSPVEQPNPAVNAAPESDDSGAAAHPFKKGDRVEWTGAATGPNDERPVGTVVGRFRDECGLVRVRVRWDYQESGSYVYDPRQMLELSWFRKLNALDRIVEALDGI